MAVGVRVRVIMAFASSGNAESFIHGDEGEEADHDAEAKEEIAVWLDHDEAHMLWGVFTEENFREKVEERIAQKASNCESNHNGQRRGVDVRGA